MRRHDALQPLSRDHHHALVLARRLRDAVRGDEIGAGQGASGHDAERGEQDGPGSTSALAELRDAARRAFDLEIEPHFRVEERCLLPALRAAGETELVRRTEADHEALRRGIRGEWSRDTPARLGRLLEGHVRFEERILFVRAEEVLEPETLEAIRKASLEREGAGG